jgi:methyl-accepting chemotaxis protein
VAQVLEGAQRVLEGAQQVQEAAQQVHGAAQQVQERAQQVQAPMRRLASLAQPLTRVLQVPETRASPSRRPHCSAVLRSRDAVSQ